jgi:hypothetical protein
LFVNDSQRPNRIGLWAVWACGFLFDRLRGTVTYPIVAKTGWVLLAFGINCDRNIGANVSYLGTPLETVGFLRFGLAQGLLRLWRRRFVIG